MFSLVLNGFWKVFVVLVLGIPKKSATLITPVRSPVTPESEDPSMDQAIAYLMITESFHYIIIIIIYDHGIP